MLQDTSSVLGDVSIQAHLGLRQGDPLSILLFIFYLEPLIVNMRKLPPDDWLHSLHTLLLMDDTAILATSREAMDIKLQNPQQFPAIVWDDSEPGKKQIHSGKLYRHVSLLDGGLLGYSHTGIQLLGYPYIEWPS